MYKIMLDPGHGGKDPGGGSNAWWKEKDKVLEISLYQEKRLIELGFKVILTRREDIYIGSNKRPKLVIEAQPDLCISNHINACGGDGAEVITSLHSDKKLANIIADEIKKSGQNIRRVFDKSYSYSKPNLDYYYMHRETGSVETIIVEYGFADNKADALQLKEHWKEYAEAVVKALCIHFNVLYVPPTVTVPEIKINWQEQIGKQALIQLKEKGLLNNPQEWENKLMEPTPLWLTFELINRLEEKINVK